MFNRLLMASAICVVATAALAAPAQAGSTTVVTLSAASPGVADVAMTIKGTVRPASTGRRVYLQEYNATSRTWITRDSGTTSRTGAYADSFTASAGTKTIRLYVPKSGTRPAAVSAAKKIVLDAQTVSLTMSAPQGTVTAQPAATVTVSPKTVRAVSIQRYVSGVWTTVATMTTNATTGNAGYRPPTNIAGVRWYRAAVAQGGPLKALVSAPGSLTIATPAPSVQMVQVAGGAQHTCGRGGDNKTYCWGLGSFGRLGNGGTADQAAPVKIAAPAGVILTQLTAGVAHTCGLGSDTTTYCWGANYEGELGNGSTVQQAAPVAVDAPAGGFTQLTAGGGHTCGLGSDTKTYCWGWGANGRLGNGDTATQLSPVAVAAPDGVRFTQLTAGGGHTCGLGSDSTTYCWGNGYFGQLGNGSTTDQVVPVAIAAPAGVTFTQLTAGDAHTCGLGSDTTTYCWGGGSVGELGNGDTTDQTAPVAVTAPTGVTFTQLTAGGYHTCALGSDTTTYCWGTGYFGQLGNGDTTDQAAPVAVATPAGVTFTQLTAGSYHTCAVGSDTKSYCWGNGVDGRLGNGDTVNRSRPMAVWPAGDSRPTEDDPTPPANDNPTPPADDDPYPAPQPNPAPRPNPAPGPNPAPRPNPAPPSTRTVSSTNGVGDGHGSIQRLYVSCPAGLTPVTGSAEILSPRSSGGAYLVGSHLDRYATWRWVFEWDNPSGRQTLIRMTILCQGR